MRRMMIAGVAVLGFLAVGLTMGQATPFRPADADGAAAMGGMGRPDLVATVETGIAIRAEMLAANACRGLAHSPLVG